MGEKNLLKQDSSIEEKELKPISGWIALFIGTLFILSPVFGFINLVNTENDIFLIVTIILFIVAIFIFCGLKIVNPNESIVFVLFVNPFVSAINPTYESQVTKLSKVGDKDSEQETTTSNTKKISLKAMTLNNQKQKVNDELGNPIIIGTIVIWRVINPTKAVFNVENYKTFLSTSSSNLFQSSTKINVLLKR